MPEINILTQCIQRLACCLPNGHKGRCLTLYYKSKKEKAKATRRKESDAKS